MAVRGLQKNRIEQATKRKIIEQQRELEINRNTAHSAALQKHAFVIFQQLRHTYVSSTIFRETFKEDLLEPLHQQNIRTHTNMLLLQLNLSIWHAEADKPRLAKLLLLQYEYVTFCCYARSWLCLSSTKTCVVLFAVHKDTHSVGGGSYVLCLRKN
ncbi:unnamed protein product [Ceratitis capitata]|uniref:(Mediterranean fruit fly) hypothetical protein n=1 Tax=Ceratitis capitata TaxID=7213 RepID=A0A811V6V7_CERCA|nr:unnamed protein product [Ceratitis capitata]